MHGMLRSCTNWTGLHALAFFILAAVPAQAQDSGKAPLSGWEVKGGLLLHDAGLFSAAEEQGFDVNGEILFPSPPVLGFLGAPRPHMGASIASEGISQIYGGLTWDYQFGKEDAFFLTGAFGGAIHNADELDPPKGRELDGDRYLGCQTLFRLAAGVGYNVSEQVNVQFYMDHISNGTLCDSNEGLENSGLRMGYKF